MTVSRSWTTTEIADLKELYSKKRRRGAVAEFARTHNRSIAAVTSQAWQLGLKRTTITASQRAAIKVRLRAGESAQSIADEFQVTPTWILAINRDFHPPKNQGFSEEILSDWGDKSISLLDLLSYYGCDKRTLAAAIQILRGRGLVVEERVYTFRA